MPDSSRKRFGGRPEIFSPPPSFVAMCGPEPGQWFATAFVGMETLAEVREWLRTAFRPPDPEELEELDGCDMVIWRDDRVAAVVFNYGRPDERVILNPAVAQGQGDGRPDR